MNIPEETIDIIKPFISHFNKYKSPHLTKQNEKQLHQLLLFLYNDIHNSFKKVEKTDCCKGKSTKIETSSDRIVPDSYNSSVFPRYIRAYIEKNETGYITYESTIGGRAIKIIFTLFDAATATTDDGMARG